MVDFNEGKKVMICLYNIQFIDVIFNSISEDKQSVNVSYSSKNEDGMVEQKIMDVMVSNVFNNKIEAIHDLIQKLEELKIQAIDEAVKQLESLRDNKD